MLVAFSVAPLGVSESVADAVADAVRIVRESGLPNRTDSMFTTIEGEWDEVMDVVKRATEAVGAHAGRVSLVLKVMLPRWKNDQPGELPEVPTVSGVWRTADWHEREAYDLCGVQFTGHPNLRRILCPEDWVGHPLRKDYEMPLEYHGIRNR